MERHDEQSRAHPEPEAVETMRSAAESRRGDPLESPAPTADGEMDQRTPEERAAEQSGNGDRTEYSAPRESGAGTYETTTRGDDYAAQQGDESATQQRDDYATQQRDDYATQQRDDFAAQAPSAPPSGPQQDVSREEAAERMAVQPATADASRPETSAGPDQPAPLSNQPETSSAATATGQMPSEQPGVLSREDAQTFQVRWEAIQTVFVDDPQAATGQADALVGEVMDQLLRLRQEYLTQLRGALGDGADTEAMRIALRRYRAFFNVLLGP
jgi:hypothetical protein